MRVFVTGATGFVGAAIVKDLLSAGHEVTGLVRSSEKAILLEQTGATSLLGGLDDLDALRAGATKADAIIHTAFEHDFTRFADVCRQDALAIEALGSALKDTARPLVVTAGAAMITPGRTVTENDAPDPAFPFTRRSEFAARALIDEGVRATTVRLALSIGVQKGPPIGVQKGPLCRAA